MARLGPKDSLNDTMLRGEGEDLRHQFQFWDKGLCVPSAGV